MQIILASSSSYRRELLARLQLDFTCIAPEINESVLPGETPLQTAQRLAALKAAAVAARHPQALVIGSDQVADFQGEALGKPEDIAGARAQLLRFSGQKAIFHSALCVQSGTRSLTDCTSTECQFLELTENQINAYLAREPATDVAGSAKIESLGISLMRQVSSTDPSALIGLPLIALCRLLREFGIEPLSFTAP